MRDVITGQAVGGLAIMGKDCLDDRVMLGDHIRHSVGLKSRQADHHQPIKFLYEGVLDRGKSRVSSQISQCPMEGAVVFEKHRLLNTSSNRIAEPVERTHRGIVSPRRPGSAGWRDNKP